MWHRFANLAATLGGEASSELITPYPGFTFAPRYRARLRGKSPIEKFKPEKRRCVKDVRACLARISRMLEGLGLYDATQCSRCKLGSMKVDDEEAGSSADELVDVSPGDRKSPNGPSTVSSCSFGRVSMGK